MRIIIEAPALCAVLKLRNSAACRILHRETIQLLITMPVMRVRKM